MLVLVFVCSTAFLGLALSYSRQSVWTAPGGEANLTLLTSLALTSRIRCVAACLTLDNCSAATLRGPCQLWAPSDQPTQTTEGLYQLISCVHQLDPCGASPCHPSATCQPRTQGPHCFSRPFRCSCPSNREGPLCEQCATNRTGPNCDVDVSGSVLVDGVFFFLPAGLRVDGKQEQHRPNCTQSRLLCAERGMRLLSVASAAKNNTLAKLQLHLHSCLLCFYQLDLRRNSTRSDVWWWGEEADGLYLDAASFRAWYYGQPDNAAGENYAALSPNNHYAWADVNCTFPAYYICEYDPSRQQ